MLTLIGQQRGFSSQRYKTRWVEFKEPCGWFAGEAEKPVDALPKGETFLDHIVVT